MGAQRHSARQFLVRIVDPSADPQTHHSIWQRESDATDHSAEVAQSLADSCGVEVAQIADHGISVEVIVAWRGTRL